MEGIQDTLAKAGIFQGVDADAVAALIKEMETLTFSRGTTIFDEGEPGDRLYIIVDGKVKLARHAPDGRENLLSVMGPSDMFGELSIFDPGPRTSSAVCVTEVTAATMDSQMLKQWITDHPEISQQLLRVLARRLRRTAPRLAQHAHGVGFVDQQVGAGLALHLGEFLERRGVAEHGVDALDHDQPVARLAFEALEVLQRHVEKVA